MPTWSAFFGTPPQFARRMAFATALGLFFGLIGPFGSYDSAPLERVASWLLAFWAGTLTFGAAYRLAECWAARSGAPRLFARCVAVLAACLPLSALAALCFHLIAGVRLAPRDWLLWYAQVVAIGLPTTLGYVPAGAGATPSLAVYPVVHLGRRGGDRRRGHRNSVRPAS